MNHPRSRRFFSATVATMALAAAMPLAAMASHGDAGRAHLRPAAVQQPIFVLGREGGNIRPLKVSIAGDGTVTVSGMATSTQLHLSGDALNGLLKLANAEGFFAMPAQMVGHGLPDIAGRYITIHTSSMTKSVHVRFVRNAAFDQLYAVLLAAAGVAM